MNEKRFNMLLGFFERHPVTKKALVITYKYLPLVVYAVYPMMIVKIAIMVILGEEQPWLLIRELVVPAVTFGAVTVFRKAIDLPRPYETLNINPIVPRDKKGHSFPSRHTASVFIIAMALLYVSLPAGIIMFVIGTEIAASRIFCGVHYFRDVLAGAVFSIICGYVGFFVL